MANNIATPSNHCCEESDSLALSPDHGSKGDAKGSLHGSQNEDDAREYGTSVLEEDEEFQDLLAGRMSAFRTDSISRHLFHRTTANPETRTLWEKLRQPRYSQELVATVWDAEKRYQSGDNESISSVDTSVDDLPGLKRPRKQVSRLLVAIIVGVVIALEAFFLCALFLWGLPQKQPAALMSNGTHSFAATTILISLDGFRADFVHRGLTPALNSFIASGVSPKYMLPSFPSVTFPNHFTLVTGLYPESHGVVGNTFWDPELGEEFYYTDPLRSMQPKWWNAEPLWATAEMQGIRTAIHMWPGSEAHIPPVEPTYLDKFNGTEALPKKAKRILELLDLPGDFDAVISTSVDRRPQLIAAYVPNIDADGHKYGPNSTEIFSTISEVDEMLALLFDGLNDRNLTDIVNLVVVSDHGMATTSNNRLIQLDDLMAMSLVDHIDGWPLRGLRLKNVSQDLVPLQKRLAEEAEASQGFDVYSLDTMPERYHFTNNKRIAPLWVVPRAGWAVVERTDFDVAKAEQADIIYHPRGIHGYDHEHPLMRAIFVARGPAFPHAPHSQIPNFQNVEVYNIICDSLGIVPHSSNGTLHLPFKPIGLHDQQDSEDSEILPDPPSPTNDIHRATISLAPDLGRPRLSDADDQPHVATSIRPDKASTTKHVESNQGDDEAATKSSWRGLLDKTLSQIKQWINNIPQRFRGDHNTT